VDARDDQGNLIEGISRQLTWFDIISISRVCANAFKEFILCTLIFLSQSKIEPSTIEFLQMKDQPLDTKIK